MSFTREQLEERRSGIGASEAAAVLGLNPYRTPLEIWMDKKGMLEIEETPAMRLGTRLEPVIAEMYQETTGLYLVKTETLYYPKNQILFATPDRIVIGRQRGLEIKTANARMSEQWGESGSDEIPQYYLIQCILCMAVTGFEEWDVAALIGGQDFRIYTINRDVELENTIIEKLLEWWNTYIGGNKEPEIDSSQVCADYLATKYPKNFRPLKQADEVTNQLLGQLADVRHHLESYEEQEMAIKNLLKNYIGDADGVQGILGRATWKKSKDSKEIYWEGVVERLFDLPEIDEILCKNELDRKKLLSEFTIIKPGSRRFLFTKSK